MLVIGVIGPVMELVSVSCGVGYQYETRQCLGAGFGCVGESINVTTCNTSVVCPSILK